MPASKYKGLLSRYTAYAVLPSIAHAARKSTTKFMIQIMCWNIHCSERIIECPALVGFFYQQVNAAHLSNSYVIQKETSPFERRIQCLRRWWVAEKFLVFLLIKQNKRKKNAKHYSSYHCEFWTHFVKVPSEWLGGRCFWGVKLLLSVHVFILNKSKRFKCL